MKKYALIPQSCDRAESFYNKATIIEYDNGEIILQSYSTEVCKITKNGDFVRMWSGYSQTTMRHINSFLQMFGIDGGGKKWWTSLEVANI